jgi:hypothetical protein
MVLFFRTVLFIVLLLSLLCGTERAAFAQPARTYLDTALAAMGGRETLLSLKSQRIVSHGENFEPEQALRPGAEPRKVSTFSCTLVRDLNSGRLRYEWQRESVYPVALSWRYTRFSWRSRRDY